MSKYRAISFCKKYLKKYLSKEKFQSYHSSFHHSVKMSIIIIFFSEIHFSIYRPDIEIEKNFLQQRV